MCTVKAEGLPLLCKADEIGELVICSVATGTSYYGLPGMTKSMFEASVGRLVVLRVFLASPLRRFDAPAGVSCFQRRRAHQRAPLHQDGPAGLHRTGRAHLCGGENGWLDGRRRASAQRR